MRKEFLAATSMPPTRPRPRPDDGSLPVHLGAPIQRDALLERETRPRPRPDDLNEQVSWLEEGAPIVQTILTPREEAATRLMGLLEQRPDTGVAVVFIQ